MDGEGEERDGDGGWEGAVIKSATGLACGQQVRQKINPRLPLL
jgi:hypothetical protein